MNLSAPAQSTKAYQRKQQCMHAELEAFVKAKAGRSQAKVKAAIKRAAIKGQGHD